jgi:hypothetical protein
VLQHGAVLLGASPLGPELAGINDLSGGQLAADALIEPWSGALAKLLRLDLRPENVDGELRETAQRLQIEKYAQRSWTERR